MPTVTFQVIAGASTYTHSKTVSGPDLTRFADALRGQEGFAGATDEQVVAAFAQRIFSMMRTLVKQFEADQAKRTAEQAITEISLT